MINPFAAVCFFATLIAALFALPAAVVNAGDVSGPVLREAGWLQSIRLEPYRVRVTAKLDTGAKSSALHATEVERFERAGVERVRFSLFTDHTEQAGDKLTYDLPIVGQVRVKRSPGKPPAERVIVRLSFCIDGEVLEDDFSLDNRANRNYPVLLGRAFLRDHFLVNAAKTFVLPYDCPSDKTRRGETDTSSTREDAH